MPKGPQNWSEFSIKWNISFLYLTIISVNVRDRVCMCACLVESLCIPNRLRYGNMNGTMLSQIVRGMFLAHQVYQK